MTSLDRLRDHLETIWHPLAASLGDHGIALVARGLDPWNDVREADLHVSGERYRRMAAHYARRGDWGRRMMRQTAALHVNVDAPGPAGDAWIVANAVAPLLLATFANSSRAEGDETGVRSARAAQWRRLDPTRTGVFEGGADPVEDYLDFALAADAFLMGPEGEPARPFGDWLGEATPEQWQRHLTTLFPEVRPRRYLEVRSVDALPLEWTILPAAVLAGLLFDAETRTRARAILPAATLDTLERAGCAGLADPGIRSGVETMLDLAQEGLQRLGDDVAGPEVRSGLARFRADWTDHGRDPGHRSDDQLIRVADTSVDRP